MVKSTYLLNASSNVVFNDDSDNFKKIEFPALKEEYIVYN